MTRGGVGCGLPPRGTPLTSVDVAPHLAEHAWPVDSGPQEFSGAVQSLVAHVVVERCEDIRLQSTWKDERERSTVPRCGSCRRRYSTPSFQEETRMLLE